MAQHSCTECDEVVSVFRLLEETKPIFPPPPPSKVLRHEIISGMCQDLDPASLEEAGCAVCGLLTPSKDLTPKDELQINWDVLKVQGVSRRERRALGDPIEEIQGPILADDCDKVCTDCEDRLLKGRLPLHSLANHFWIGRVPWQLRDLSFAEKMLICKVRHNRCVVRVASGRGKLSANAIMFSTPVVQIYEALPLSRDQLSEVLACVFLGSARPMDEEFLRTPMLVRRDRVKEALHWLKLNHRDYDDLNISRENLKDLPENGIFCGVEWKETQPDESNNIPEAMSVHDDGEEEGTTEGPCTFAVHGLTGVQYDKDDIKTLKAKALEHLKRKGQTLGVGQSEEPQSIFRNPQLYPQMFPWLFPYGFGGIGHPSHKYKLSEMEHKRHLLMYHDKRFQTDLYFPMIAFNDAQIKAGKTGSHLLACFDLLEDLEHAGGKVQGSLTGKKYMCNEVWSLIAWKGAPSWFITFSPVDINHPLCLSSWVVR
ncbi:hypothetical protein FB451DRAFT_1344754 [Mycena latifolia]|nr:hypothetical protein FB451DRAFT_1344754 [Mycena latifolia]